MAKQTPNVYLTIKHVAQAYEARKRGYLLRREAGEISRAAESRLVQELDSNLKYALDYVISKIDSGAFDSEAEPDVETEDTEASAEVEI